MEARETRKDNSEGEDEDEEKEEEEGKENVESNVEAEAEVVPEEGRQYVRGKNRLPRQKPRKVTQRLRLNEQRLTNPKTGIKKIYLATKDFVASADPVRTYGVNINVCR